MRPIKITQSITPRENENLNKYLQEIGKEKLITLEKEVELAQKIKKGDQEALEKLVRANLRFVVSVAKMFQRRGLPLQDLINEGNLGLIRAAKSFDETRGFKFISWAVWWIRQAILQALAEQTRIVRIPLNRFGAKVKVAKALNRLEQKFERKPTDEEIAEALNMLPRDVTQAIKHNSKDLSLDFDEKEGDLQNTGDVYDRWEDKDASKPDKRLIANGLRTEIERSMHKLLSAREKDVLRRCYGLNEKRHSESLNDIADDLGLSRERVRQIRDKATLKIGRSGASKLLKEYLDSI